METSTGPQSPASTEAPPAASGKPAGRRGNPTLTLLTVAIGVMMVALDGTIVAVANPAIQSHLHASLADIQWVSNAYLLALAVALITAGKLGDRFGHKKIFMIGVAGFALSSAAIGLGGMVASSITMVIAFRVLQGVFGAMLQPTALALLRETFPAEKLNGAIGAWGAVVGASTAAGPIVGGLLVQHINWESCFFVNVPVGIAALTMAILVVKETPPSPAAKSFDIPGIVLLSGTLFLLIWGLIKGDGYGWGSAKTIGFLGGAVVLGIAFAIRELKTKQPLLPLNLFRSVSLSAGVVLVILLMFAMFGAMFFMTFYLENVHGMDPVSSGVHLLPMTAMLIIGAPLSSLAIGKIGPRFPMVVGMLLAGGALYGLSRLTPDSDPNSTIVWFIMLGLGLSPVMVGATDVIVGNAPVSLAGVAGGLQSTAMQLGGTLGTAVLGAVMSAKINDLLPKYWGAAHLPSLSPSAFAEVKSAVSVGDAPVTSSTPKEIAALITHVTHETFTGGMHASFLVAAVAGVIGAAIALLTRRGHAPAGHV
jgi:EmrB/QacA subfamily drug resistance transporter